MQRIDENTYIDDTLVTCAEYQLFIDEMREQGKYYQPDHWTSHQFPAGQAREHILGMRHSDAVAFCVWLTRQERNDWSYRLPTKHEATQFPKKQFEPKLLGYWVIEQFQSAWIGFAPKDPRGIELITTLVKDLGNSFILEVLDHDRTLDSALDRALALDLDHSLEHAQVLNRALEYALTLTFDNILTATLDRARLLTNNVNFYLNLVRALNLDRDYTRDLDYAHECARDLTYTLSRDHTQRTSRDLALDLYIDIFTLQERIAGRSPAFEGIRLVKERIR